MSYLTFLRYVYSLLEQHYPNEYVYKNEFINNWLIGEIGLENSRVYNEFRLGKAVADLAMFNGNSKVFEIKTLLDTEIRLSNQLFYYGKIFNEVYVVVPELKLSKYIGIDTNIGIISYKGPDSKFELIRKAEQNTIIDVEVLMQVLHTNEYESIVKDYFGETPQYNDFTKFKICKTLLQQIPTQVLNDQFVRLMKIRKRHNSFSARESELNQIFLSLNFSEQQKKMLVSNLRLHIN